MRTCIVLIALFLAGAANAQKIKPECKELFARRVAVADLMAADSAALTGMYGFLRCGLDTVDLALMLRGPVLENIFVELSMSRRDTVSYGDLYDKFRKAMQLDEYRQLKSAFVANEELKIRKVGAGKWREDSLLLSRIGMTPELIRPFRDYLRAHEDLRGQSYETAFGKYLGDHPPQLIAPLQIDTNVNIALERAKAEKKPLLIFFSGYGCENCEKMYDLMIAEPSIGESMRHHFVVVRLRVDDRHPLPEMERVRSEGLQRSMRNVGERNLAFEMDNYQTMAQPYWVVADYDKKALVTLSYTRKIRDIQMFLAAGLDNFRQ